jgi:hypothetical protein
MSREKACSHNAKSLLALAQELTVILETIREIAHEYQNLGLKTPILIDNQTSVDKALMELNKFKNKARIQIQEKRDERRVRDLEESRPG